MKYLVGLIICAAAGSRGALAEPIVVFGTGLDGTGVPLPGGFIDPNWQMTMSADLLFPGPSLFVIVDTAPIFVGGGTPNTPTSKWIGPRADGGHNFPLSDCTEGCLTADYHFTTTFDLTGLNPAMSVLTGQWSADDSCSMLLNGALVASYPFEQGVNWRVFAPLTVTNGFVPGINTLTVVVNNQFFPNSQLRPNPMGVQLQISGESAPCPIPFADVDADGDVDQRDFAAFQGCYSGTGGGVAAACSCLDRVGSTPAGIDQEDLEAFQSCRTGPNVSFDPQNPPPGCVP